MLQGGQTTSPDPKGSNLGLPRYIFWESTDDTMSNEAEDDDETPYLEAWDELSCEILHHKPDRGKMLCAHQPAVCLRRLGAYQLSCLSPGHDQDDADKETELAMPAVSILSLPHDLRVQWMCYSAFQTRPEKHARRSVSSGCHLLSLKVVIMRRSPSDSYPPIMI